MNADGFRSNDYCHYCLKDGCFTEPHITMGQMIERVAGMAGKMNMSEAQAREMANDVYTKALKMEINFFFCLAKPQRPRAKGLILTQINTDVIRFSVLIIFESV